MNNEENGVNIGEKGVKNGENGVNNGEISVNNAQWVLRCKGLTLNFCNYHSLHETIVQW